MSFWDITYRNAPVSRLIVQGKKNLCSGEDREETPVGDPNSYNHLAVDTNWEVNYLEVSAAIAK